MKYVFLFISCLVFAESKYVVEQKKDETDIKLLESYQSKYKFNQAAPQSAMHDGEKVQPLEMSDTVLKFIKLKSKDTATLYICDHKVTFCTMEKFVIP